MACLTKAPRAVDGSKFRPETVATTTFTGKIKLRQKQIEER